MPLKLLFVCSRNQWRSPTAERVWARSPDISARSAGTGQAARRRVSEADIHWADLIFAMEEKHKARLMSDFRQQTGDKAIHVLDIPDDYRFMDPDLVALIRDITIPIVENALP